jgi:N-acetylneuraminic acid mutarotase
VFVFDGTRWVAGPNLPLAVNHPAAATIGNDVYVAGGFSSGGATNRVFVLTPGAPAWREVAAMRRPRGALGLLAAGGKLYAIGGLAGTVQVAVPEVYDPATNTWADLAPMPHPRNHVAAYLDGSFLCVAGGREPATSAQVDCLDPATGAWQERAPLPQATSGAAGIVLGGVTMVAGGEPSSETSILPVIQEQRSGTWSTVPMLVPRHGTGYAVYQGRLWMCGGATAPGYHAVADCTSAAP